jgi:hypothetical protein
MAFELSPDISTDTISFQITMDGTDALVQIPVGFDAEQCLNYTLWVVFSPSVGDFFGEFELTFYVLEWCEDTDRDPRHIWDGLAMRQVTSDSLHLERIAMALHVAVSALIKKLSPQRVHMSTLTPHLPRKALRKFNMIATLFRQNGYRSGKGDSYHGRHIWMIVKQ